MSDDDLRELMTRIALGEDGLSPELRQLIIKLVDELLKLRVELRARA